MKSSILLVLLAATPVLSAEKKAIVPAGSAANSPFSPAIQVGNGTLFVAGQIGRDRSGQVPEAFEDEVRTCLDNVGAILKEAGYDFKDAVAVQVYLTDMGLFQRMNDVYTKFFPEPRPSRTTVGVAKLVSTARIEITVTAWKNPGAAAAGMKAKKQKREK